MKNPELNPNEEISFSSHLIKSEISSIHKDSGKLFEIRNNPDKIVRMESFEDLEKRYKGKVDPNIYLVDADLYMRDGKVALCNTILWLYRHMISVEKKYGKKFTQARKIIAQILNTPLPQNITKAQKMAAENIIKKTKGYFDDRIPIDNEDAHPIFSDLE